METQFYFSKYQSGENSVELVGKGDNYSIVANGAPVFSSESLPEALGRFYKEVSAINSAQESGKDLSMHHFGNEVVKLNRIIIPKLEWLGRSKEASYMKSLNTKLEEAMDYFFMDTLEQKIEAIKLFKFEPSSVSSLQQPSINGDEIQNAGTSDNGVTPSRLELKRGKKVDENTIELKSINGMEPFPEEDKRNDPVEKATKVSATMQMKNHPKQQQVITGEEIEPTYIKNSRIEKDEAFELGRDLGVNFDQIPFEQWVEGLKIEHEHTDAVGDDHTIIGKIAHAHLKENPKYYKLLDEFVENSLRKDFPKMPEGEQVIGEVPGTNENTTGRTQQNIDGEEKKLEKEAFSMDAPKVKNMEKQEPIIQNAFDESKSSGHVDSFSKNEPDYIGEESNQTGRAEVIKLNVKTGEEEQMESGGDVRENGKDFFDKSFDDDEFNQDPIIWDIEE